MSQAHGVSIALSLREQLHSEDIWLKDSSHSDKLTKPFVKAHGQHLIHLSGWSTYALLVVVLVALMVAVAERVVY
jgi:hypothetical protein